MIPPITDVLLDPALEVKKVAGLAPEKLGEFESVLITVPPARDEVANTGDIHLKFIPEHYLTIANLLMLVSDHYRRGDFLIADLKRCAVTRHFFVRPKNLGKKIVATVKVLKNSNGLLAINIFEIRSVSKRTQKGRFVSLLPPTPEFKMVMRPMKPEDSASSNLFVIPMTDKCLEFVPFKAGKI
ncbi:hypothetical protein COX68_02165 [Candidatus Falkowbacteria bacterium CG_4_10_14_0_2_um_filter_41_15]|uniref:Uncharacterized protein n=4 Tax=Candidatus Falkowiibacteriota TaxID=1752728 RepID=A0A2G9ZP04_9BACT|nr:MAG: hypothetical protein AUJ35_00260 [Candidatus Falkowbacteria bacterium CG1_02_41_21]PIP34892.1 MAG: hypothetical protein COX21_00365 [Candidatus Falkowbacteria bacterium CG23_combo_of_CG06-09_8_20_14_all_41_10]PIZ09980.1 MAG: hypothetical protein COY54_02005 [Candidatus Falkowbacteria bacterium CG_4_10_14_0_8_um_filter_41_36]PJA09689.1 MAG: hypothetical protein COX68_02165 [Candidatus Falkowbacteria bacterium CG_4_10_14_0_2_um_filter_41_15]